MPVKTAQPEKSQVYFCTFTCHNWLHLFQITDLYGAIYRLFDILQAEGNQVLGYVLMPNHLHLLVWFSEKSRDLNRLISSGKRFMAFEIVKRLAAAGECGLLQALSEAVDCNERKKGKKHQVFRPSLDAKSCHDLLMMEVKLGYMHRNPVAGKWQLVEDYVHYPHSSARFYELGEQGAYPVVHYRDAGADLDSGPQ